MHLSDEEPANSAFKLPTPSLGDRRFSYLPNEVVPSRDSLFEIRSQVLNELNKHVRKLPDGSADNPALAAVQKLKHDESLVQLHNERHCGSHFRTGADARFFASLDQKALDLGIKDARLLGLIKYEVIAELDTCYELRMNQSLQENASGTKEKPEVQQAQKTTNASPQQGKVSMAGVLDDGSHVPSIGGSKGGRSLF